MDGQDLHPPDFVRPIDQHLPIEPPGAQQRGIEDFRPVGRRQHHDGGGAVEPVHLRQQLVQRLLLLVLPTHRRGAARPSQRVELVDEDDAGGGGASFLEQVAHAGCADAHEHLDEFGAVGGEEGDPCLTGHGAGQQGLAGAGWADQQDAARDMRAEAAELVRAFQEIDDLMQFGLGFVHAGHIVEGDFDVGLGGHQFGLGAADGE